MSKSDKTRDSYYRKLYGIGIEEYTKMHSEQNGCCAICGKPESYFKKRLAVDHNHKTGKVRGLLCFPCNRFKVGKLNIDSAEKVYNYFLKYDPKEIKENKGRKRGKKK